MMEILSWIALASIVVLAIYVAKLAIDRICKAIVDVVFLPYQITNTKKTQLHYYDYPDRYFDYVAGQWIFK